MQGRLATQHAHGLPWCSEDGGSGTVLSLGPTLVVSGWGAVPWTCCSARAPGGLGLSCCLGLREGVRPGEAALFEYRAPRSWGLRWGLGRVRASPELLVEWPPEDSTLLMC